MSENQWVTSREAPVIAAAPTSVHLVALGTLIAAAVVVVVITFLLTRAIANRNSLLATGHTIGSHHLRTSSVVALVACTEPGDDQMDLLVGTLTALSRQSRRPQLILVRSTDTPQAHARLAARMLTELGRDHRIQLLSDTRPVAGARALNQLWSCVPHRTGHVVVVPVGHIPADDAVEQVLREFDRTAGLGAVDATAAMPSPARRSWWSRITWRLQRLELGMASSLSMEAAALTVREADTCTTFSYDALADLAFTRRCGPWLESSDPGCGRDLDALRLVCALEALGHRCIRSARFRVDVPAAATMRQWWQQRLLWQHRSSTLLVRHGLTSRTRPLAATQLRLAIGLARRLVAVLLFLAVLHAARMERWPATQLLPYAAVGVVLLWSTAYRLRRKPKLSRGDRVAGALVAPTVTTAVVEGTVLLAGAMRALSPPRKATT